MLMISEDVGAKFGFTTLGEIDQPPKIAAELYIILPPFKAAEL